MAATSVPKLYRSVIEDVVNNVREAFLDEGVDEQVLIELKQTWEKKLAESKAIDHREPESVQMSRVTLQPTSIHVSQQQHHHPSQSSQMASSAIAHQLTLPPGHLVQQALLQYAASQSEGMRGDGQKTVTLTVPQKLTITLPAHMAQGGLQTVMLKGSALNGRVFQSSPAAAATLALPPEVTASLLHQAALNQGGMFHHSGDRTRGVQYQTVTVNQPTQQQLAQPSGIIQLDGNHDTSDDEEEEEEFRDNDDNDDDDDQNDDENDFLGEEEVDPLNSEDDVSDDDPSELFDTDNVVVCQYDKITRSRNRWKFHLKDGIMNLQGKDYVFQKAVGDAEW